jgi:adenine-specific DNA-methyltransferase
MGTRYIGAKTKISNEIINEITKVASREETIVDLMCGTGAVSLQLRKEGYKVIAIDVMSQATHITKVKLLLQEPPSFANADKYFSKTGQTILTDNSGYESIIQTLNNLQPIKGYFWREFSPEGKPVNNEPPRKYFTSENAQKIDAARAFIKTLKEEKAINDIEYSLLIHDLIMAVNDVANIAGTYGHYLSRFISRANQPIKFIPANFEKGGREGGHEIFHGHAENFAKNIQAKMCYIDPPYIKRQYAANYHILETIAKGDEPQAEGKSGLRPWRDEYSDFCSKIKIYGAFEKIITEMDCNHFLISYSSDGLLTKIQLLEFFKKFGEVSIREFPYKRFKSRNEEADECIVEYLFHLNKTVIRTIN